MLVLPLSSKTILFYIFNHSKVLQQGKCVELSECGCIDETGILRKVRMIFSNMKLGRTVHEFQLYLFQSHEFYHILSMIYQDRTRTSYSTLDI